MSGKTFRADKTPTRYRLSKTAIFMFVALVVAISALQLGVNLRTASESKEATAAAIFFAESVEQMCEIDAEKANNYQGLCREANEYTADLDSVYNLGPHSREVSSIVCEDDGSTIHFKDGTEFNSDRRCGDGPLFVDP